MSVTPTALPIRLRNIVAHLRIWYSLLLAPPFFLVWALSSPEQAWSLSAILCFLALQLGLYPASQGFNSVYDRDEGPIGGLESPPPLDPWLLPTAQMLDLIAIAVITALDLGAGLLAAAYSLVSRAYSHPRTRWKARPWLGWGVVSFFQGPVIVLLTARCLPHSTLIDTSALFSLMALSVLFFAGSYPLTQVYQQDEDRRRGDLTLSRLLGVRGTFHWWSIWTLLTGLAFASFFQLEGYSLWPIVGLGAALFPSLLHTLRWRQRCFLNPAQAPAHRDAMRSAWLASLGVCLFLILFGVSRWSFGFF